MTSTLVVQSYRSEDIEPWISTCLDSARTWAARCGFDYRFVGDEIFELLPDAYRHVAAGRLPVLTDLGRLLLIRSALDKGYDRAIWVDADVLVFGGDMELPSGAGYAFCREIWVQPAAGKPESARLQVYRNVHNAICLFERENAFLDFYIHACERIVGAAGGSMPNQIVGTKFLTALHNMMRLPLIETVGMFSPLVIRDLVNGGGPALQRLMEETRRPLAAANLCSSLAGGHADGVDLSGSVMAEACARLREGGLPSGSPARP